MQDSSGIRQTGYWQSAGSKVLIEFSLQVFFIEGKPKCEHFDSPSGATEGGKGRKADRTFFSHLHGDWIRGDRRKKSQG
jgi:hypothetical protein